MTTHDSILTPRSGRNGTATANVDTMSGQAPMRPLLSPASAYPVLDADVQSFVDSQPHAHAEMFDVARREAARNTFHRLQGDEPSEFDSVTATEDLSVPSEQMGEVSLRIVRPREVDGALPIAMYFHGGGWLVGDRSTHDRLIREIAATARVAIVFVEYTLTEGAVFPRQNEEAYAALLYVVAHADRLRLQPNAVALVGDGVGGNMVAAVAMMAKARRGPALALQVMFYPILTRDTDSVSYNAFSAGPWISAKTVKELIDAHYAPTLPDNALAMPLSASVADLEGHPAALIITAENDVVRDQGESYARKLMQAGVEVTATRYLGTIHDFVALNNLSHSAPSKAALAQTCAMLILKLAVPVIIGATAGE